MCDPPGGKDVFDNLNVLNYQSSVLIFITAFYKIHDNNTYDCITKYNWTLDTTNNMEPYTNIRYLMSVFEHYSVAFYHVIVPLQTKHAYLWNALRYFFEPNENNYYFSFT